MTSIRKDFPPPCIWGNLADMTPNPVSFPPPQAAVFRQSELLFQALIENAHDVILMLDAEGRILYASPAVRNYGRDPAQVIGQDVWNTFHPDDLPRSRQRFDELLRTPGAIFAFEARAQDAAGRWRWKHAVVQNLLEEPSVRAIVVNVHDITERKEAEDILRQAHDRLEQRVAERTAELRHSEAALQRANDELEHRVQERTADLQQLNLHLWEEIKQRERAEEEIRKSEERFRNVVEDQTEFIVRWLPDGTRTFVNSAYCRFFGQPREQLLGQAFFNLVCEEDRERVRRLTQEVTPEHPVTDYEHRVIRPDGTLSWTQWNDRAIFDEQGRLLEYQSVGRDISAQKEAEEQLRQQQEALAHVGRLSVMGEMAAAITHEIGQPLHAIATFAVASQKALQAERADSLAKASEWAGKIEEQVQRTTAIIGRLRDFTRLAASHRQPLDLNTAIRESLALVAADLRRRRVQVGMDLSAGLPEANGDRIQIEQVLVNLLRNAAEAMDDLPAAERQLQLRSCQEPGRLLVTVRDAGLGMTDEGLAHLGEAFYTTKPNGMGIGLAISRRIVEEHGGQLWATRNPDRGMTFAFDLPLVTAEAPASTPAGSAS